MKTNNGRPRGGRRAWTLLATASVAVVAQLSAACAQEPIEEVLVTGSLIRGAAAVGVTVTGIDATFVAETAKMNISDVLSRVPSILVNATSAHEAEGRNPQGLRRANIHRLGESKTLVMVDGMRLPLTGAYYDGYDPSILPAIALERVEVLPDGASATYGSDAITGVINLILRRRFDGASSQAMYQYVEGSGTAWQASQLYGKTWGTGDLTVSFDYFSQGALRAADRRRIDTYDFTEWNGDNRIPLASSIPATVTFTGNGALPSGQVGSSGAGCTNCFLVPKGQNGQGLTYATLQAAPMVPQTTPSTAGTNNLVEPRLYSDTVGAQQRASATLTFDQRLFDGVELFIDGFYSNNRHPSVIANLRQPWVGGAFANGIVPSTNPYYPVGTPAGTVVRVSYSLAAEITPRILATEHSGRWDAGFNVDLPYDWKGKLFFARNEESNRMTIVGIGNPNNVRAALGNIVGDPDGKFAPYMIGTAPRALTATDIAQSGGTLSAYAPGTNVRVISPAVIPFLNVFCDPTQFACNDPKTLAFVSAHWIDQSTYGVTQWGAQADGPLFTVPAGEVRAAIGATYVVDRLAARADYNQSLTTSEVSVPIDDTRQRDTWGVFGQINVPLFGEANAVPLLQNLDVEISGRYDHLGGFGSTFNPKLGANWLLGEGFTLRGAWGKSYAAPAFQYIGILGVKQTTSLNFAGGAGRDTNSICTANQIATSAAPTAGSAAAAILGIVGAANCSDAAIDAALAALAPSNPYFGLGYYNPAGATAATRISSLRNPGIVSQTGGASPAFGVTRPPGTLKPEAATNWSLGFDFAPSFIRGLDVYATYWNLVVKDYLSSGNAAIDLNNPTIRFQQTIRGDDVNNPAAPFTTALTAQLLAPSLSAGVAAKANTIAVVGDGMSRNLYRQYLSGIDFGATFDWDMGEWGVWRLGTNGSYYIHSIAQASPDPASKIDTFRSIASVWGVSGDTQASRLTARGELSWKDTESGWSAGLFVNYRSHFFVNTQAAPAAVLDFVFGTSGANSLTLAANAAALAQAEQTWNYIPEWYTFDLTVSYDLADRPMNPYLKNLAFRVTANDIMDRNPPMAYVQYVAYSAASFSPYGRTISLQVTKNW